MKLWNSFCLWPCVHLINTVFIYNQKGPGRRSRAFWVVLKFQNVHFQTLSDSAMLHADGDFAPVRQIPSAFGAHVYATVTGRVSWNAARGSSPAVKGRGGIYRSREKERWRQMLLKSHVISGRAATPISSPYYSNLSEGEKSNIPRPGTFNTSSQDPGRQAGRQAAGRGIKHQDFQRGRAEEGGWLCSTPAS